MRRMLCIALLSCTVLLSLPQAAFAHDISKTGLGFDANVCAEMFNVMGHGTAGGGRYSATTRSHVTWGGNNCNHLSLLGPFQIALRDEGYVWTGSSWAICWATSGPTGDGW